LRIRIWQEAGMCNLYSVRTSRDALARKFGLSGWMRALSRKASRSVTRRWCFLRKSRKALSAMYGKKRDCRWLCNRARSLALGGLALGTGSGLGFLGGCRLGDFALAGLAFDATAQRVHQVDNIRRVRDLITCSRAARLCKSHLATRPQSRLSWARVRGQHATYNLMEDTL
jgi:hypothetical protein